jgi:hypothetical protein
MDFYRIRCQYPLAAGGEAKRIRVVRVGPSRRVFRSSRARPTHENQRKRVMKTIRRLSTRLVLETDTGLASLAGVVSPRLKTGYL